MNYAVIKTGSKQYKVQAGQELLVEKLAGKPGDQINFKEVLLVVDQDEKLIGQPYLEDAVVSAKIISQKLGNKIRVATYKAKSRYRKVKGHRQKLTQVKIESINSKKTVKRTTKKARTSKN